MDAAMKSAKDSVFSLIYVNTADSEQRPSSSRSLPQLQRLIELSPPWQFPNSPPLLSRRLFGLFALTIET